MPRSLRVLSVPALLLVTGLAACDVGGETGDDDQPPMEVLPLCTAEIALTGTFTAAAALDPAGGCQPTGTWAVTATVSDKGTCATVPIKGSYSYTISGTGRGTQINYTKATGEEFKGSVIASGSGGCKASVEHILPDGSNFQVISLSPATPTPPGAVTTLTITGSGQFELWNRHP